MSWIIALIRSLDVIKCQAVLYIQVPSLEFSARTQLAVKQRTDSTKLGDLRDLGHTNKDMSKW